MAERYGVGLTSSEKLLLQSTYPGGSNRSIIHEAEKDNFVNPTEDFFTHTRSYLDVVKRIGFQLVFWLTLSVVFLAGSNRVNIFSLGYIIGAFVFLWQGMGLYLRPIHVILKWWNYLLLYNVSVIFLKTFLQMFGCLFIKYLDKHACWAVQLIGIACPVEEVLPVPRGVFQCDDCPVYEGDVGLGWDAVSFGFLIIQRRMFNSYYFFHVINEARAMSLLATRGAQLIEEISKKRIAVQQKHEKRILGKIRNKIERVRAIHRKSIFDEPESHFVAIRSGDAYMFEGSEEDSNDTESSGSLSEDSDEAVDKQRLPLSLLFSNALKKDLGSAVNLALQKDEKVLTKTLVPESSDSILRKRAVSILQSEQESAAVKEGPEEPLPGTSSALDKSLTSKHRDLDPESSASKTPVESKEEGKQEGPSIPKFIVALLISAMVTVTIWLNKYSREYRYVMKILTAEKKFLKRNRKFRYRERLVSSKIVEPLPVIMPSFKTSSASRSTQSEESKSKGGTTEVQESWHHPLQADEDIGELDKKSQPAIIRLLMAIWYTLLSHSELICYLTIFFHQIKSPTILSLPLPLMVFFWGLFSVPRPSKTFWVTIITYTEVIVLLKCICQLEMIPWNAKLIPDNAPFAAPRIIGIERQPGMYAYYDLFLLIAVFFHRSMLKNLGLWNKSTFVTEIDIIPITDISKHGRNSKNQANSEIQGRITHTLDYMRNETQKKEETSFQKNKFASRFLFFLKNLTSNTGKVSDDVYAYMFFCDFFNILVVIIGFSSFGSSYGFEGVSEYFKEDKVPIPFLVMLIIQVGLLILDRFLYLRKNILGKIILQIVLVIAIHAWMFFVLPVLTQRSFNASIPPQMWYFVKCIYLLLSAYQIKVGYPTRITGNFLCKSYNLINAYLHKGFMIIPFVFELRALMDWMWTDTTLTLVEWLKMEQIFAHVFTLKCKRRIENDYPQPKGEKNDASGKYFLGGGCVLIIITVILFPLIWFALSRKVGEPNLPFEVTLTLQIGSFTPLYENTIHNNSINALSQDQWETFKKAYAKSEMAMNFLADYENVDVGVMVFDANSADVWNMSPPAINKLKEHLDSKKAIRVRFSWRIHRLPSNTEGQAPVLEDGIESWLMPGDLARSKLLKVVNQTSNDSIVFNNIMPKFIKITRKGGSAPVEQLMLWHDDIYHAKREVLRSIQVSSAGGGRNQAWWWDLAEKCDDRTYKRLLKRLPANSCTGKLLIYTFNDKTFSRSLNFISFISAKGLFGLYVLILLYFSRFLRSAIIPQINEIVYDEWPQVDTMLLLVEKLYWARELKEFDLEEFLFSQLIFLYRSPEALFKFTAMRSVQRHSSI